MLLYINHHLRGHTPEQRKTHCGMAHFAGTGPVAKTCAKCSFYGPIEKARTSVCRKARELGVVSKTAIPAATSACKYFEVAR